MAFNIGGVSAGRATNLPRITPPNSVIPKPGTYDYSDALKNSKGLVDDPASEVGSPKSGYSFRFESEDVDRPNFGQVYNSNPSGPPVGGRPTEQGFIRSPATQSPAPPTGDTPVEGSSNADARPRRGLDFYA